MQLSDYAQALGAAQTLIPNWRQGDMQEAQLATQRMQPQLIQAQIGQAQARAQQEAQEAAYKQQRRASFGTDLAGLGAKPSPEKLYAISARYPEFATQIQGAAKGISAEDGAKVVRNLAPVQSLIQNGKYDLAAAEVKRHIEADRAAGIEPDENDVELHGLLTSGDPAQAKAAGGMVYGLLAALNPETAAANVGKRLDSNTHVVSQGGALVGDDGTILYQSPKPEYRTIKNGDGSESIVQVGGGDPASGGGAAEGSGQPRSVRNRNPGNIRYGAFAKSQGATGSDDAGYAIFPSAEAGQGAQASLLAGKGYYGGGRKSVRAIIEKWAPRASKGGDNTEAQVDNYISYVAKKLNVSPDDTLAAVSLPKMAQAMAEFEGGSTRAAGATRSAAPAQSGPKVVFTSAPSSEGGVDSATVDFYAKKVAAGGDLPALGSGKVAAAWRQAILKRSAAIQTGQGLDGGDSNLRQADVKAARMALGQLQKTRSNVEGFERTFMLNVDQVLKLAPKGVGGSAPVFNKWIQAGRKSIKGDPDVSAFNVAVNTAANEYAKLASGASGGAVTSDSARHEAMEILNNAQTLPQLQASIRQMKIDGHNRIIALNEQEGRLRSTIGGKAQGAAGESKAAGNPPGGRLIGMYKGKQVFQLANGRRVVAR